MATKKIDTAETVEPTEASSLAVQEQEYIEARKLRDNAHREIIGEIQSALNDPFPKEVERQLKKGGAYLTYIPVSEVINRLNRVLGFDGWSYEIIKCERDALDPDFIVAHVRMTVASKTDSFGYPTTKDGFGGQKIKRTKTGEIVDLGDEFKGAVSDALKKAAQALGIGLYLARTEEAMEAEAESSINPEIESMWEQFVSLTKSFSAEDKASLNEFWNSYAEGKPKPTKTTASIADLEALIQECLNISFRSEK